MNRSDGKLLIEKKVEDFSANRDEYLSHSFHEASARARFIDPFFQALGWDFEQTHLKPHLWDVMREYSHHSTTKRPDYAFRINGELKFFVEAKAPWVPLTNKEPVFQAKRYAFSTNGKAPIVVLTDFEEFRVFNALKKPDINLPLEGALKQYDFTYEKYLTKWDLLYDHFSREAVADGALEELKGKLSKKTKTLDQEFLIEITQWREMLARNIALRNMDLTVDELNVSVQRILDRLIFIRNLEDRQIEAQGRLLKIAESRSDVYSQLVPVFRKLDGEYNGLLFKKHFSEQLAVDDKVLIHIIKHLSWPISPYQFDVIEPEILGRIYEKFLGSKIRLTAGHRAKVEERPEVRKAGGVYYTPQYIVDYIVKNTVGEKVKGKTPEEIAEIKIVDPACGSGSFLLGAFEYLMIYHVEWYGKNRQMRRYKKDWYLTTDGDIRLSVEKKADILKINIFGVDIDREATEVAIMSLYLKLLDEGFDKGQAMLFLRGHVLPDMSKNIKCGNSLIGSDYFERTNLSLFDDQEVKKVNVFDWEVEFPDVFGNGGFDAVIGNPPYVKARDYNKDKEFYRNYLNSSSKYQTLYLMWDLYIPFVERGLNILSKEGLFGYIIPDTLEKAGYSKMIKQYILKNYFVPQIDYFPVSHIFHSDKKIVGIKNIILFVKNSSGKKTRKIIHSKNYKEIEKCNIVKYDDKIFSTYNLKINLWRGETRLLSEICLVSYGLRLNSDKEDKKSKFKKADLLSDKKGEICWKPFTEGKYLSRYKINQFKFLEWDTDRCPKRLVRPTFRELYETNKLLLGRQKKVCAFDEKNTIVDNTIMVCALHKSYERLDNSSLNKYYKNLKENREGLIQFSQNYSLQYLLGILNSSTTRYFLKIITKGGLDAFPDDWKKVVIPSLDRNKGKVKSRHDQMVAYVDTMLEQNKKLQKIKTEHEQIVIQRQIDATDRKIDKLVYVLYDLTAEEVRIVEGSVGN